MLPAGGYLYFLVAEQESTKEISLGSIERLAPARRSTLPAPRHCEERSDVAIRSPVDTALSLPGASLSCLSKKVTKELSREGAELLAPAIKAALPGAHPGALFRSCGFTGSIKEDMQLTNLKYFQELRNRYIAIRSLGVSKGGAESMVKFASVYPLPLWSSGESGNHTKGSRRLFAYFLAGEKV